LDAKQIEQMSLFSGLDKRERARLAQHADEVDVPEGKRLAREGDLAYEFFVIREGTAEVDVGGEIRKARASRLLWSDRYEGRRRSARRGGRRIHGARTDPSGTKTAPLRPVVQGQPGAGVPS
jgi:hypothetical protein